MDRLIDEIVKVSIEDARAAAAATSVNTVAVVGVAPSEEDEYPFVPKVCYDQKEVEDEYGAESDLAKVTKSFFLENNPGKIVCIPTNEAPTKTTIAGLLDGALNMGTDADGRTIDFYHVIVRFASTATKTNIIDVIEGDDNNKGIEEWATENFKMCHVEISDRTVADSVLNPTGGLAGFPKRVAIYFHAETNARSLAAALCAIKCYKDPARGTWAHKSLTSVIPDATTKTQLINAQNSGLNIYATIAGVGRTVFGTCGRKLANGKFNFIDSTIKKDWIKFRVQEKLFNLLGDANDGDGIDYNNAGIDSVVASVNNVFSVAEDSEHRYILPGSYEVTAPKYEDISAEHKGVRNLPNVSGTFSIQESIHTIKTVQLQVVA